MEERYREGYALQAPPLLPRTMNSMSTNNLEILAPPRLSNMKLKSVVEHMNLTVPFQTNYLGKARPITLYKALYLVLLLNCSISNDMHIVFQNHTAYHNFFFHVLYSFCIFLAICY